jgi:glycosyltransferase involved in cell wall biosynthesis
MESKKIKIAYVINDLLVGGAESALLGAVNSIDKDKFEVIVYNLYDYEGRGVTILSKFLEQGIKVIKLYQEEVKPGFLPLIKSAIKEFKLKKPDIVHCHLSNAVIVGGVASILTWKKFIIHEHQTHQMHSWKIRLMYKVLRPFASLTICYTTSVEEESFGTANLLQRPQDFDKQKVVTILNGVDVDNIQKVKNTIDKGHKKIQLGFPSDSILIVSIARIIDWKGQRHLLESFAKIAERRRDLYLCFVGYGYDEGFLKNRIKELGLEQRARVIGARTDVYEILAASDIFSLVFTYKKGMNAEAIGISGFEAMASALPTIIGNYMLADKYIENNVDGIIVSPYDEKELGDVLLRLANDPELRNKIGEKAVVKIRSLLDWRAIIKIHEKIYTQL